MYKNAFPRRFVVSFLLFFSLSIGQTALARNSASDVDLSEILSRVDLIGPIFGIGSERFIWKKPPSEDAHTANPPEALAAFTPGNLVINRIGNGTAPLGSSAAVPISLIEFTTVGVTTGNVIFLPSFTTGGNNQGGFTDTGSNAAIGGFLHRSVDGRYLSLMGIDAPVGTASVTNLTAANANRNLAKIDAAGNVLLEASLSSTFSQGTPRSAITTNGDDFWIAGFGNSGSGVRYVNAAIGLPTTSTTVQTGDVRNAAIFAGILFSSSANSISYHNAPNAPPTSTTAGIPINTGDELTGISGSFIFMDRSPTVGATNLNGLDTLYVTEGSDIEKFEWTGSAWTYRGQAASGQALFGLTAILNGNHVDLYVTESAASNNRLRRVTDSSGFGGTFAKTSADFANLASAGANYAFRGIALAPVPPAAPEIAVEDSVDIPDDGTSNFGNQTVLTSSASRTFTIRNTGNANLTVTKPFAKDGTHSAEFAVDTDDTDEVILPGESTTFTVTFTPTDTGTRTAAIHITNNDSDENPFDINLTGNGTAPEVGQFTLAVTKSGNGTVTSAPAGIVCGSDCEADFDEDEQVTLTAAADTGWKFVGWSGGCVGPGTCVVTMDAAKTVDAEFKLISISGTVRLQNTIDRPVPLDDVLVPDVDLNAAGDPPVSGSTGVYGKYTLSGFGAGPYTVTPSKADQVYTAPNGVFIDDASLVARYVVGLEPDFTVHQIAAADVSGVAGVSSYDATLIARWVVGLPDAGNRSGKWTFTPSSVDHGAVTADIIQNYDALLFGDVNGDFEGAPPEPTLQQFGAEATDPVSVSLPNIYAQSGSTVVVPLRIDDLNGVSVRSYQFDIVYDPAVVTPAAQAADLAGTLGAGMSVIYNVPVPGLLKVAVYDVFGVIGDGVYANLRFTAAGGAGTDSQLLVRNFRFNDGKTKSNAIDGSVFVTSGNGNTVSGRLITPAGQGVRNTQVTITGPTGVKRTTSSSLGYFEFGSLAVGGGYTLSAQSRRYRFASVGVSPSNGITSVEMIALE